MTGFVSMNGMAVLAAYDFSSLGKLVDVGGGNGTLMTAILNSYAGMHGMVFDLPSVVSKSVAPRCLRDGRLVGDRRLPRRHLSPG